MEPERAEAGARDVGPRGHGAGIEGEHGEGFQGEHVLGHPRAAREAEGELGDAVLGDVVEDPAEGRGRDGAVRGEGEAAEEDRRGGPQDLDVGPVGMSGSLRVSESTRSRSRGISLRKWRDTAASVAAERVDRRERM